ncbi:spore gernimation protein [Clostridium carboxidivorans P7]|uniref:Spore germination protein n=1 Tax=Clostridium carboxidivorans P7 TaxID=536227 RepID=C6PU71_9CLOT|nr:endospore germination permease [Clostridium carboxidivorans]AKN31385.1 spore gernimation protein [Clostridium carboxidivorans P7]EET87169.1 spore germination protein [Clostridium carboxidivorans P7]EFG87223.1 spore germination protein (amino acid permease) [Clostridium carboxidivorans P7]
MKKEQITDKEGICILIIYIIGSTLIIGIGGEAKNDAWISGIASIIMFIPMLLVYSRILVLFQGKDLFDILCIIFGNTLGKIISLLYIWYAFHLGALVLRNFGEFINVLAMPETPMFVSLFCLGLVCIVAVKLGIEVIGRTIAYFIPLIFFTFIVIQLISIHQLHLNYIKPILGNGIISILKGGFSAFSFPFAETVLFIGIFNSLKTKKSPLKVYLYGVLISASIIIIVTIRNIAILGNKVGNFYFPSYEAVSMIRVGDFIQRAEVTVAMTFVFGALIKSSICLLVSCKGIGKLFKLSDYRSIVIQTGLLMIYFSYIVYDNIMTMEYWAFKVYSYYAFPFQVILPVIIWILAEIKVRKANKLTV